MKEACKTLLPSEKMNNLFLYAQMCFVFITSQINRTYFAPGSIAFPVPAVHLPTSSDLVDYYVLSILLVSQGPLRIRCRAGNSHGYNIVIKFMCYMGHAVT
jgi:hypothetical protein